MKGFVCPHCSPAVRLEVLDTRRPCAGRVARSRGCPQCGYRIVTVEKFDRVLPTRKSASIGSTAS